jgi:hypothetical protein
MGVRSKKETLRWGSGLGAWGFSTKELPEGSSTMKVKGSSDPIFISDTRARSDSTCAGWWVIASA